MPVIESSYDSYQNCQLDLAISCVPGGWVFFLSRGGKILPSWLPLFFVFAVGLSTQLVAAGHGTNRANTAETSCRPIRT